MKLIKQQTGAQEIKGRMSRPTQHRRKEMFTLSYTCITLGNIKQGR